MSSTNVPLMVPKDLRAEIKAAVKVTRLSQAEAMRQSMRLGLPELVKRFSQPAPDIAVKK